MTVDEPGSWDARYANEDTPWDLGGPPPALVELLDATPADEPRGRVLVPGAGRGHDAIAWAVAGHRVTAVDFAPRALEACAALAAAAGVSVEGVVADVLELPESLRGSFDLVWEHTCFCALPPAARERYAGSMAAALAPDGRLVALLWNHGNPDGPPFDVTRDDVRRVFEPRFEVESIEDAPSAPSRSREMLVRMRRRPDADAGSL